MLFKWNVIFIIYFRFVGGEINACYNAVDRHIKAGKGKKVALIHDSPVTKSVKKITYEDLYDKVCTFKHKMYTHL